MSTEKARQRLEPSRTNNVIVPAGKASAYLLLVIGQSAGGGVGWFDDVYSGPDPLTPVELMSFTWSEPQPSSWRAR